MGCSVRPLGSGKVCRVSARGAEPSALQDWGLNRRAACGATPGRSARWSFEGKGGALGVRARRSEAFRAHLRACVCSRANAELLRLWHHLGALRVDGRARQRTKMSLRLLFASFLLSLRLPPVLSLSLSFPFPGYIDTRTPRELFPCPHSISLSKPQRPHVSSSRALQPRIPVFLPQPPPGRRSHHRSPEEQLEGPRRAARASSMRREA